MFARMSTEPSNQQVSTVSVSHSTDVVFPMPLKSSASVSASRLTIEPSKETPLQVNPVLSNSNTGSWGAVAGALNSVQNSSLGQCHVPPSKTATVATTPNDNGPASGQQGRAYWKTILESKNNNLDPAATNRNLNLLLGMMQQRPSRLPRQVQNDPVSQSGGSDFTQSRSANILENDEAQLTLGNFEDEFRNFKGTYEAFVDEGRTRRAYLFIPQVHQGLKRSSITYRIAEVLLRQAKIAEALSTWWRCKSRTRRFNWLEPSQRQALDQIESERGKLFPKHFFIESIHYTNPRTFATLSSYLKSQDIIVVLKELDPTSSECLPFESVKRGRYVKERVYDTRPASAYTAETTSAEDFVDDMIRKFGIIPLI